MVTAVPKLESMQTFRSRPRRRRASRSATPPPLPLDTAPPSRVVVSSVTANAASSSPAVGADSVPNAVSAAASSSDGEGDVAAANRPSRRQCGRGPSAPMNGSYGLEGRAGAQFPPLYEYAPSEKRKRPEKSRIELLRFGRTEAMAAAVRTVLACMIRAVVWWLAALKMASGRFGEEDGVESVGGFFLGVRRSLVATLSVAAGAVLMFFPSKMERNLSPGFYFACPLVLFYVGDWHASLSNIPCRVCETVMGRLTFRELFVAAPAHLFGALLASHMFSFLAPTWLAGPAIDPIIYSEGRLWLFDLASEAAVNAVFAVVMFVTPEVLKLNDLPREWTLLVAYPLFSIAVDAAGTASTFAPDIVHALQYASSREEVPIGQSSHMIGPILGGVVGGMIMNWLFPDEV